MYAYASRAPQGYSVECGARSTRGVLGFAVTVTSAHASPVQCEQRAHRFVHRFVKRLRKMRSATFNSHVTAAVASLLVDDHSIGEEGMRHSTC